jgi:hypothetical protein
MYGCRCEDPYPLECVQDVPLPLGEGRREAPGEGRL